MFNHNQNLIILRLILQDVQDSKMILRVYLPGPAYNEQLHAEMCSK